MKKAMATVTTWLNDLTDLLKALIVFGILSGIIWDDYFGVIGGIGKLMGKIRWSKINLNRFVFQDIF